MSRATRLKIQAHLLQQRCNPVNVFDENVGVLKGMKEGNMRGRISKVNLVQIPTKLVSSRKSCHVTCMRMMPVAFSSPSSRYKCSSVGGGVRGGKKGGGWGVGGGVRVAGDETGVQHGTNGGT